MRIASRHFLDRQSSTVSTYVSGMVWSTTTAGVLDKSFVFLRTAIVLFFLLHPSRKRAVGAATGDGYFVASGNNFPHSPLLVLCLLDGGHCDLSLKCFTIIFSCQSIFFERIDMKTPQIKKLKKNLKSWHLLQEKVKVYAEI